MEILMLQEKNRERVIKESISVLTKSGIIVAPTDTVYGLLADATNEEAVDMLIQFKARPPGKPISVFVSDFNMMKKIVDIKRIKTGLLHEFFPGPFTVILPSLHKTSLRLESERGTIGVRIPDYSFITTLVSSFGKPVTATSANISWKSPHYNSNTLIRQLSESKKNLIDLVVDGGTLPRNKPSTVIDLTEQRVRVVRKGDIVFRDEKTFLSESPAQTKKVAYHLARKILLKRSPKPIIIILQGDLGVGKTVFVKGIAQFFSIENIVSPTFVVSYEYEVHHPFINVLVHVDLYNVDDQEEFNHLGLDAYLKAGTLMCFEWGEKTGEIIHELKEKGEIVYIKMKYISEKEREITVQK